MNGQVGFRGIPPIRQKKVEWMGHGSFLRVPVKVQLARRASGFTNSQAEAPRTARIVAARNEASHPKRAAISGVSEAVTAAPTWQLMFTVLETTPANSRAKSAVTDQKQLCDT